jgi:hypothetical protein
LVGTEGNRYTAAVRIGGGGRAPHRARRRGFGWLAGGLTALFAGLVLIPSTAQAAPLDDEVETPSGEPTGAELFQQGRDLFLSGRYDEALPLLERAFADNPSPNSELLIARSLRFMGKLGEAYERFDHAQAEAARRVAEGEDRYGITVENATRERDELRTEIALLELSVADDVPNAALEVDGKATPASELRGRKLALLPGTVRVVASAPDHKSVTREVTLAAGATVMLELVLPLLEAPPPPPPLPPPPPPPPVERPLDWKVPTAIAAGGLGVIAFVTAGVFGASAQSAYDDLDDSCAPNCGDSDRAAADAGQRDQILSNVFVVMGAASVVAAGVLTVFVITDDRPSGAALRVDAQPGGLRLIGRL